MALYMETTAISAERTAQEIGYLLAEAGANAILTEYGKDRKITGLSFRLRVAGNDVPFKLPVRVDPVFLVLQKRRSSRFRGRKEEQDRQQAERVAWRQLLRWIQAQLAMIETGMVAAEEVFLPYVQVGANQTLFERMMGSGQLALPAPEDRGNLKEFRK